MVTMPWKLHEVGQEEVWIPPGFAIAGRLLTLFPMCLSV